jgi:hypothetical protein
VFYIVGYSKPFTWNLITEYIFFFFFFQELNEQSLVQLILSSECKTIINRAILENISQERIFLVVRIAIGRPFKEPATSMGLTYLA